MKRSSSQAWPSVPPLSSLPVDIGSLDRSVAVALQDADRKRSASTADAARESTFPFLESPAHAASHAAAYSAASLFWAESQLDRARSTTNRELAQEAVAEAIRALDLAMLRGGLELWAPHCEPLVMAASQMQSTVQLDGAGTERGMAPVTDSSADTDTRRKRWEDECHHFVSQGLAIPRVHAGSLSVDDFRSRFMEGSGEEGASPVILCGAIDDWPARRERPWSIAYLREQAGSRLVKSALATRALASRALASRALALRALASRAPCVARPSCVREVSETG